MRAIFSVFFLALSLSANAGVPVSPDTVTIAPAGSQVRTTWNGFSKDYPPGSDIAPDATVSTVDDSAVETVTATHPVSGATINSEGSVAGGSALNSQSFTASSVAASAVQITIDRMTFGVTYSDYYYPTTGLVLFGPAKTYFLSDGSSWNSGAGSYTRPRVKLERVEVSGTTIRYFFSPPAEGFVYQQTDYNGGEHSSNGSLGAVGALVLEAELGSTTALIKGDVEILSNTPANYPEPKFNYWGAPVGSIAPFEATFTLLDGATFNATTFDVQRRLSNTGTVDFASSRRPPLEEVRVVGTSQVPAGSTVEFNAVAIYEGGSRQDVTGFAEWSVSPTDIASVEEGLLTTTAEGCAGNDIELRAIFTSDGVSKTGTRLVQCRDASENGLDESWDTYQGDERHSGYIPVSLEPDSFTLRWKQEVAPGFSLNPATAADGKVFVTSTVYFSGNKDALFVLDARDGEVLWSKGFGSVFSVNPPAYGYGNVYVQTGNHGDDTYLWAFDAKTGEEVFKAPHSAQWERYFAPTIFAGEVYINGGYYGGMYAFNAFSGASRWFRELPQYDQWTPAVDQNFAYAYVGEYTPALYVMDRKTGQEAFRIADPNFDWRGWSMNLAPVLGSQEDVLAIHNNRLIKFDLVNRRIGMELTDGFTGQPAVAKGTIYAINRGGVEARNESDGALVWRWQPDVGAATEHVIVTDSHVLARTGTHTFALDALSGAMEWSYPEAGHMTLGNDTLYIVSPGSVTAIAMPGFVPSPPSRLEIVGPVDVSENSAVQYTANVVYEDGRVRNRTLLADWSIAPEISAGIGDDGELTVGELQTPEEQIQISATYSENGVEVAASLAVTLRIGVSNDMFVFRNLAAARQAKQRAIQALEEAERRESAAKVVADANAMAGKQSWFAQFVTRLQQTLFWTSAAKQATERSINTMEGKEK